jgi:superfamily II DNA/RNA helicase
LLFPAGKDVLAKAKTGTGKTVAFLVLLAFSLTDQFDCYSGFLNYCSDTT